MKTFKISEDVRAVLARSEIVATPEGWTLQLPPSQLDRGLYVAVNKVLAGAGGTWVRRDRVHRFARDPRETLQLAVERGVAVNEQQLLQRFYTPIDVANRLTDALGCQQGHRLLEPSAGEGALIDTIVRRQPSVSAASDVMRAARCVEIDEVAAKVLQRKGYVVEVTDFLKLQPTAPLPHRWGSASFDRIAMNPPFSGGADVAHVTHALRFLAPRGVLVAVMSLSVRTKRDKATTAFRTLLAQYRVDIEEIPAGAFHESGTEVATLLYRIEAP